MWGGCSWLEAEQLQTEAGRRILGVLEKTANDVVRGEMGWWTLKSRRDLRRLKFWGRIVRMDEGRLVKQVYNHFKASTVLKRNSWSFYTKRLLMDLNLGHLWVSEEVGDLDSWNIFITQVFKDREVKQWKERMERKPKLRLYRSFKSRLAREEYLDTDLPFVTRKQITQLRSGTNKLRIESGRWNKEALENRICKLCSMGVLEDEVHFLLECHLYERQRLLMLETINHSTPFVITKMSDDKVWMVDFLLGHGPKNPNFRLVVYRAVGQFIDSAMRLRRNLMGI